jgi:class 3 adenylate cyclase
VRLRRSRRPPRPGRRGPARGPADRGRRPAAGELDLGVGVACGQVWVGQVGAASRLGYTVIGDPVNEAARLADLAKDVPGRVVASAEAVRDAGAGEERQWAPGVVAELRGRHRPTPTWVLRAD